MPSYDYIEVATGRRVERIVPIAARDAQPGLTRIAVPPRVALAGVAQDIHDQSFLVREGLRDMETRYGRDALRRDTGMKLGEIQAAWAA
jgi:hypothetical protein